MLQSPPRYRTRRPLERALDHRTTLIARHQHLPLPHNTHLYNFRLRNTCNTKDEYEKLSNLNDDLEFTVEIDGFHNFRTRNGEENFTQLG